MGLFTGKVVSNPELATFSVTMQGNLDSLVNFVIDNNTPAVYAILKNNGYTFNNESDAAVIVKNIILSANPRDQSTLAQLQKIPYNNDENVNGTGGVIAPIGSITTSGLGDDLMCLSASLFKYTMPGCASTTGTGTTAAQQAQIAAAQASAKSAQTTVYVVGGLALLLIILVALYFSNQNKKELETVKN